VQVNPLQYATVHRRDFIQSAALAATASAIAAVPGISAAATSTPSLKESAMSAKATPYIPLTSDNATLVLVDHQVGLLTGVRDITVAELKSNVMSLAKAMRILKVPIIVTTTSRESMWGPTFPELVAALPEINIIDRSSVNAWDDPKVAAAIEATGRKKLIFAGVSLEVCAAFPAITALGRGYDAYVPVDACGTFSQTKREAGLIRMQQAGVILSDYATLAIEILKDNSRPDAGAVYAALAMPFAVLVGQIAHAYGK
jgi:nicotinamidase-related amidase